MKVTQEGQPDSRERTLARRAEQVRAIADVGRRILAVLTLEELLPYVAGLLRDNLGYFDVNILLLEGDELVLQAGASDPSLKLPVGLRLPCGGPGIVSWVATSGQPLLANDVREEPRYYAISELKDTRSELAVPIKLGEEVAGVLDVESDRVNAFDDVDVATLQVLADQIAVAIANARLFAGERRGREETAIILDVTRALSSSLVLDKVLGIAAEGIDRAVGFPNCEVYLLDEAGQCLQPRAGSGQFPGSAPAAFASVTIDVARNPFVAEALERKAPVAIADAGGDLRCDQETVHRLGLKSVLAVPLVARDKVLGMVLVTSTDRYYTFSAGQLALAAGIANSAALAVENAQLYERTRELAVVEERNRLAREIHDTLTQSLTGVVLQLEAADQLFEIDLDRARQRLRKATNLARESLQEARRSVWNLHPVSSQYRSLGEAIEDALHHCAAETGLQVGFEIQGEPEALPPDVVHGLYRIAQEALANVAKHARAANVSVQLCYDHDLVTLRIRDDGCGFLPAEEADGRRSGFGLLSMRERANLLGGVLEVESAPGTGTSIAVRVPAKGLQR